MILKKPKRATIQQQIKQPDFPIRKVTFFQKELTNVETKLVLDKFPYNLGIKSPMIIGNIIFLFGLLVNNDFRRSSKNLIAFQICGYLVQMFLEDNDIHLESDFKLLAPMYVHAERTPLNISLIVSSALPR